MSPAGLQEIASQTKRLVHEEVDVRAQVLSKDFDKKLAEAAARWREDRSAGGRGGLSWGSQLITDPKFVQFLDAKQPGTFRWEKDFTRDTVTVPMQHLGMVGFVNAEGRMREILPATPASSNAVVYSRAEAKTVTGSITQVNEGDLKAKASWNYVDYTANIITSAETAKVSVQCAEDLPAMGMAIDNELSSQVLLNEEDELLNGPGTKGHMQGFMTIAPTFSGAVAGDSGVDIIIRAIGDLTSRGYNVSGVVLPPGFTTLVSLMKDTLGRYIFPQAQYPWSLKTVTSPKMPAGKFLVGAFSTFSVLLDRSRGVQVATATMNEDDFLKNMLTVRADLRSGLAILRPEGFLQGSLTAPPVGATTESEPSQQRPKR